MQEARAEFLKRERNGLFSPRAHCRIVQKKGRQTEISVSYPYFSLIPPERRIKA